MPSINLNDYLFRISGIFKKLVEIRATLTKVPAGQIDSVTLKKVEAIKKNIRATYFEGMDDAAIEIALASKGKPFNPDYPALQQALRTVFSNASLDNMITAIKALNPIKDDWTLDDTTLKTHFERLDKAHGYFQSIGGTEPCNLLFKPLVSACRKHLLLIEKNNDVNDKLVCDYAYKLMALFIDEKKPLPSFNVLSKKINALLIPKDKKLQANDTPLHDVLFDLILPDKKHDRAGWIKFIEKEGRRALPFFVMAPQIEEKRPKHKAPQTIQDAKDSAVFLRYARAKEDTAFARLCYDYNVPEETFNRCLNYIGNPALWPKKSTDDLPDVIIQGEGFIQNGKDLAAGYCWVKLPPDDKRALILGKITDCCQSIGGESEKCVKDAVSLSDNGLYVLLKHKRGDKSKPKNNDGSINYENFQIVGQSYLWKSRLGNLGLDSIECLSNSIPKNVLRHVLSQFAHQVSANDSRIGCIQLGRGGGTPSDLFPKTEIPVKQKQGVAYGDADFQYMVVQAPDFCIVNHPELNMAWERWKLEPTPSDNRALDFLAFLRNLPLEQRLQALQAKDRDGRTLLHASALNITSLSVQDILPLYGDDAERLAAIHVKDGVGNSVLYCASNNPSAFNAIWAQYSDDAKRLEAVTVPSDAGYTVLGHATNNTAIFKTIWHTFPNDEARFKAVYEPLVYKVDDQDSKKKIPQLSKKYSILREAVQNTEVFHAILGVYPEKELLEAIVQPNRTGRSVLQEAVTNVDVFSTLWALYPDDTERLKAIQRIKLNFLPSLLQTAATHPDVFIKIWSLYTDEAQRLEAITETCYEWINPPHQFCLNTVLSRALGEPQTLKLILDTLPSDALLKAVNVTCGMNGSGNVLYLAIKEDPEALMAILEKFSSEQLSAAFGLRNMDGETVFNCLAENPETCMMVLNTLPRNKLLEYIKTYMSKDNETILHDASGQHHTSPLLKNILEILPQEQRLEAVEMKSKEGNVVLSLAPTGDDFIAIWNCYPAGARRLNLLREKNWRGQTVLERAGNKPGYFLSVLHCLTISELIQVLEKNPKAFHFNNRREKVNHIEICQAFFQQKLIDSGVIPEETLTQLEKEIKQATHMDELLNPKFLTCIEQLPTQVLGDQKDRTSSSDFKGLFHKIIQSESESESEDEDEDEDNKVLRR